MSAVRKTSAGFLSECLRRIGPKIKRSLRRRAGRRRLDIEPLEVRCLLTHPLALHDAGSMDKLASLAAHGDSHPAGDHSGNSPAASGLVDEIEPPSTGGQNNTQGTAQFLPHFGTGTGDNAAMDIAGFLGPVPPSVTPVEDNGSITLANPTGLVAGVAGRFKASGTIGDGPHGSTGTQSGDYDHFRVSALANQLLTIDVELFSSTFNSVAAINDSSVGVAGDE